MTQWFYAKNGKKGLAFPGDLANLVQTGELLTSDLVMLEDGSEWKRVDEVIGHSQSPPVATILPSSGTTQDLPAAIPLAASEGKPPILNRGDHLRRNKLIAIGLTSFVVAGVLIGFVVKAIKSEKPFHAKQSNATPTSIANKAPDSPARATPADKPTKLLSLLEASKKVNELTSSKASYAAVIAAFGIPTDIWRVPNKSQVGLALWEIKDGDYAFMGFVDAIDGKSDTMVLKLGITDAKKLEEMKEKMVAAVEPEKNDKPVQIPRNARQLKAVVNTVDKFGEVPYLNNKANTGINNLKVYATDSNITIAFDCDSSNFPPIAFATSLLVRIFDSNGQYLTHFTTKEKFTPFRKMQEMFATRNEILGETLNLLSEKGNKLTYTINKRDLRDAAAVEVGFFFRQP